MAMNSNGGEKWRPITITNASNRMRNVGVGRTMPDWISKSGTGRAGPAPPPPPSPSNGRRGQFRDSPVNPDPDYEVIECPPSVASDYMNSSPPPPPLPAKNHDMNGSRQAPPPRCDLCGSSPTSRADPPCVRCEQCAGQTFCRSCDLMYHRHPKRQQHARKPIIMAGAASPDSSLRPPLPPKGGESGAGCGPIPPVPPPRRNKRPGSAASVHRQQSSQPGSPATGRRDHQAGAGAILDRMGSLKRMISGGNTHRPLPATPNERQPEPPSRPPGGGALDTRLSSLQERYRQHQEAMRNLAATADRTRKESQVSATTRHAPAAPRENFNDWTAVTDSMAPPPPQRMRAGSVSGMADHQQAMRGVRAASPSLSQSGSVRAGMSASVFDLNRAGMMSPGMMATPGGMMMPLNPHQQAVMHQAHSMAQLNCTSCGMWPGQQQQFSGSNQSLNSMMMRAPPSGGYPDYPPPVWMGGVWGGPQQPMMGYPGYPTMMPPMMPPNSRGTLPRRRTSNSRPGSPTLSLKSRKSHASRATSRRTAGGGQQPFMADDEGTDDEDDDDYLEDERMSYRGGGGSARHRRESMSSRRRHHRLTTGSATQSSLDDLAMDVDDDALDDIIERESIRSSNATRRRSTRRQNSTHHHQQHQQQDQAEASPQRQRRNNVKQPHNNNEQQRTRPNNLAAGGRKITSSSDNESLTHRRPMPPQQQQQGGDENDLGEDSETPLGPPPSPPDADWECEHCTFVNAAGRGVCEVCCKTPSGVSSARQQQQRKKSNFTEEDMVTENFTRQMKISDEPVNDDRGSKRKGTETENDTKTTDESEIENSVDEKPISTATHGTSPMREIPEEVKKTQNVTANVKNETRDESQQGVKIEKAPDKHDLEHKSQTNENKRDQPAKVSADDRPDKAKNIVKTAQNRDKAERVSTGCGPSPPREIVPETVKTPEVAPKSKSTTEPRHTASTGTSPPPQSISTQTYEELPVHVRERQQQQQQQQQMQQEDDQRSSVRTPRSLRRSHSVHAASRRSSRAQSPLLHRSLSRQSFSSDTQSLPNSPPRDLSPADSRYEDEILAIAERALAARYHQHHHKGSGDHSSGRNYRSILDLRRPDLYQAASSRRPSYATDLRGERYSRRIPRAESQPPSDALILMDSLEQKRKTEAMKSQGLELVRMLREAEQNKYTAEELQAALVHCSADNSDPVAWLRANWSDMIDTVRTLATNYGRERSENTVGTVSITEARDALRQHRGNVWASVTECVEQRQKKYADLMSRGQFTREDVVTSLTAHHGDAEAALLELNKSQLRPFLMRIWGPPAGIENDSAAPAGSHGEHHTAVVDTGGGGKKANYKTGDEGFLDNTDQMKLLNDFINENLLEKDRQPYVAPLVVESKNPDSHNGSSRDENALGQNILEDLQQALNAIELNQKKSQKDKDSGPQSLKNLEMEMAMDKSLVAEGSIKSSASVNGEIPRKEDVDDTNMTPEINVKDGFRQKNENITIVPNQSTSHELLHEDIKSFPVHGLDEKVSKADNDMPKDDSSDESDYLEQSLVQQVETTSIVKQDGKKENYKDVKDITNPTSAPKDSSEVQNSHVIKETTAVQDESKLTVISPNTTTENNQNTVKSDNTKKSAIVGGKSNKSKKKNRKKSRSKSHDSENVDTVVNDTPNVEEILEKPTPVTEAKSDDALLVSDQSGKKLETSSNTYLGQEILSNSSKVDNISDNLVKQEPLESASSELNLGNVSNIMDQSKVDKQGTLDSLSTQVVQNKNIEENAKPDQSTDQTVEVGKKEKISKIPSPESVRKNNEPEIEIVKNKQIKLKSKIPVKRTLSNPKESKNNSEIGKPNNNEQINKEANKPSTSEIIQPVEIEKASAEVENQEVVASSTVAQELGSPSSNHTDETVVTQGNSKIIVSKEQTQLMTLVQAAEHDNTNQAIQKINDDEKSGMKIIEVIVSQTSTEESTDGELYSGTDSSDFDKEVQPSTDKPSETAATTSGNSAPVQLNPIASTVNNKQQNLSKIVEDTQRIIKQMKDEINSDIASYISDPEERISGEESYESTDYSGSDWESSEESDSEVFSSPEEGEDEEEGEEQLGEEEECYEDDTAGSEDDRTAGSQDNGNSDEVFSEAIEDLTEEQTLNDEDKENTGATMVTSNTIDVSEHTNVVLEYIDDGRTNMDNAKNDVKSSDSVPVIDIKDNQSVLSQTIPNEKDLAREVIINHLQTIIANETISAQLENENNAKNLEDVSSSIGDSLVRNKNIANHSKAVMNEAVGEQSVLGKEILLGNQVDVTTEQNLKNTPNVSGVTSKEEVNIKTISSDIISLADANDVNIQDYTEVTSKPEAINTTDESIANAVPEKNKTGNVTTEKDSKKLQAASGPTTNSNKKDTPASPLVKTLSNVKRLQQGLINKASSVTPDAIKNKQLENTTKPKTTGIPKRVVDTKTPPAVTKVSLKSPTPVSSTNNVVIKPIKTSSNSSVNSSKDAKVSNAKTSNAKEASVVSNAEASGSSLAKAPPEATKKKSFFRESCFSDDEILDDEEYVPEPAKTPKKTEGDKSAAPVVVSAIDKQEDEEERKRKTMLEAALAIIDSEPVEHQARRFLSEGLVRTYSEGELAVTLLELNFDAESALYASSECGTLDAAVALLSQECELCTGKYAMNQMVSMLRCVHRCCRDCARNYFTIQITDRAITDCVCPFCKVPDLLQAESSATPKDEDDVLDYFSHLDILLKGILDGDVHELFQRKLRDRTLMQDPNFKWCVKCSSGFFAHPRQKRLICPDCRSVTCAQCRRPWEKQHEGISCEMFAAWKEANDPDVQAEGVARHLRDHGIDCPKCKFRYALSRGGCMHFTCSQCKHEFCCGCGKQFAMGVKCGVSQYCGKLGLHAHHPRNCLFYLRDKEPHELQRLLKINNVAYDVEPPPAAAKESEGEGGNLGAYGPRRCNVQLQKETPDGGMVDSVCGADVLPGQAGLCRGHYVEYLVSRVRAAGLDPLPAMDLTDCVQELRRRGIALPERGPWDTDDIYRGMCQKIVLDQIPLD